MPCQATLEPEAKGETSNCDPGASAPLTSSCRRVSGSLLGFLRVHDWHILLCFHNILLVQASHQASSVSRGWEINSISGREEQQNHIAEGVKSWGIFVITHWQQRSSSAEALVRLRHALALPAQGTE